MEPGIRFCTTADGVRIAYAVAGRGPPLVWPPGWVSNLQVWLESPPNRSFLEALSEHHTVVQYDRHGCGLSERKRTNFGLNPDVAALEAVVGHLGLQRFALFGFSDGGPPAIAYSARHPDRVARLVLYDTYAARVPGEHPRFDRNLQALAGLVRATWPIGSRALADVFFPSGTDAETQQWFARWQQASADAETAARLLTEFRPNLRPVLHCLSMPTLVLHRRWAMAVPYAAGRELASLIPHARFLPLDGDIHFPGYGDAESILRPVLEFLAEAVEAPRVNGLTLREVEVLRLIAEGKSNSAIGGALGISTNTVDRHVSNIYTKIGAANRAEAASYAVRNGLA